MNATAGLNDDTQRISAPASPTQPLYPQRQKSRGGSCILIFIIAITALSLVVSVSLLLGSLAELGVLRVGWRADVSLIADGELRRLRSGAASVAQLLDEAGIIVAPESALSHDPDAPLFDGMLIEISSPRAVRLTLDGEARTIRAASNSPRAILEAAGIALGARDRVFVNGALALHEALDAWTAPVTQIEVRRTRQITVIDGDTELRLESGAETVAAALAENGILLDAADVSLPALDAALQPDMRIQILRATPIQLVVDGVTLDVMVQAATVMDALREVNANLFGDDYVKPGGDAAIVPGLRVEIVRVADELIVDEETIPFQTRFVADSALPLDERAVTQAGQVGIREARTALRFENGVEVSRSSASVVVKQPVDQIVSYGAKVTLRTINTPVGPRHYWRALCMLATSYRPRELGGDDTTAIGWKLTKGVVAADPTLIPYRTQVFVPGYGVATMADTGGPRSSPYWIDLGYSDDDFRSWLGYVKVYLLAPAPPDIDFVLPRWTPNRSRPGSCDD